MVEERKKQLEYLESQRSNGARGAQKRWGHSVIRPHDFANGERMANDSGVGVGLGVGVQESKETPNPTASAVGPPVSLSRKNLNGNDTPRQRGTNPRARGANPRGPWQPRKWYGEKCTQAVAADYTPPGPISISPGGRRGIELPGGEWRPFTPQELTEWQSAVMRVVEPKH
jgi:hypothetical protein